MWFKHRLMNAAFKRLLYHKDNATLNYAMPLWSHFTSSKCQETMSGFTNWRDYITRASTDETVACWVRIFLARRNNSISLLPPCVITRWFVTFCGKDASCYCLKTCILNPTEHQRHKHMWKKRLWRRRLSQPSFSTFGIHPRLSVSTIFADPCRSDTFGPIFPRVALVDCPVDSGPNCQPKWKQTAAGQERLQEAICFYKVDMERAGLFCWKWLSSSLSPWPRAPGSVRARLVQERGGEGRPSGCELDALVTRTRGDSQAALS